MGVTVVSRIILCRVCNINVNSKGEAIEHVRVGYLITRLR